MAGSARGTSLEGNHARIADFRSQIENPGHRVFFQFAIRNLKSQTPAQKSKLPGITSPPAIVARAGITRFISMAREIDRTEPSQNTKLMLPDPWTLPQALLHWFVSGLPFEPGG